MNKTEQLISACEKYCSEEGIELKTLSRRVLNDGKALDQVKAGGKIGVERWERVMNHIRSARRRAYS